MALLIMFSTVASLIPMGNMNLFSDAMASGKNSDKYENSQEYESYYSNDKQYAPDYNYYYEPMKQQQSSYDNNNNYNYDDTKRISYSDSYEDMKKYSTYPTKDKKYVCQTGQFKGFFVESVEFCKLKIVEGPQEPIGPTGATGATGATGQAGSPGQQGPSGITFLNSTNIYLNQTTSEPVGVDELASTNALCDPGDFVVSGGYITSTNGIGNRDVLADRPTTGIPPSTNSSAYAGAGWETSIEWRNASPGTSLILTVSAFCFDNPPLRP
jgi:hypothetical protein